MSAAAASAWLPAGSARPLHWWSEASLAPLREKLALALARWSEQWGVAVPPLRMGAAPARRAAELGAPWRTLQREQRDMAWLQAAGGGEISLAAALFPAAQRLGPWATRLASECRGDALERLASCLEVQAHGETSSLPERLFAAFAGTVECRVDVPLACTLLLSHDLASRLAGPGPSSNATPREALENVGAALSGHAVALAAEIDGCELSLGALQGLRTGDVVRLRHTLERPAVLRDGLGRALCTGYLGRQAGRRALELAPKEIPR